MTEAEFLARLRRLPLHQGAAGLADDVARLGDLVLTTDTLVEGIHYLPDDPPEDVAWKLVAVNLSDLAAKGAVPIGVLLNYPLRSAPLPATPAEAGAQPGDGNGEAQHPLTAHIAARSPPSAGWHRHWDEAFLDGLNDALTSFAAAILGGDTVSLPAEAQRVLTLTAIGSATASPTRSGARPGDALYVTGTIGDAGAGLAIARGQPGPAKLLAAYRRPQPRLAEGQALAPLVHAMMDVSDGLLIDAARMAAASGAAVAIDLAAIPLSAGYRAFAGEDRDARLAAATAGDDYQLLFAAPPGLVLPVPAARIGSVEAGAGLRLSDAGAPVPLPDRLGYLHGA